MIFSPNKMSPLTTKRLETKACTNPVCFFCLMQETNSPIRRAGIQKCFREMPHSDHQDHVLVLSSLWHTAMSHPNHSEYPSLGVFHCMASLIHKGIKDKDWLSRDQNVCIPYYAAHVIGSYTMNSGQFAKKAVDSGVIPPLIQLLRGKMSWVEQRVAVRALGHLASYKPTFEALVEYEDELVKSAMEIASTCLDLVYTNFVGVENVEERLKYHRDLLTRGVGGREIEDRKAEEWASQLQSWSLHLLKCFASKGKYCLKIIWNNPLFLTNLCEIANYDMSTGGIRLIRTLTHNRFARKFIVESREMIYTLCNLARSSDDCQYIGIDCLLILLKDPETRHVVIKIAVFYLIDLVEITTLGDRTNVGEAITQSLLSDYKQRKIKYQNHQNLQKALREIWDLKVERKKKEALLCEEKLEEKRVFVNLLKRRGNDLFRLGDLEGALRKYTQGLDLCPLKFRKERLILHSNKAQCHLMLGDSESAIRDSTRALCYSDPINSHRKSLWRRSQAYDMKGLAKESLMDCILFVNGGVMSKSNNSDDMRIKIPYHAARMISKQMDATWVFGSARLKKLKSHQEENVTRF